MIIPIDYSEPDNLPDDGDLENNFLLIDDVEGLPNNIKSYLYDWINRIITTTRRLRVRIIISTHLAKGHLFSQILNEARYVFLFPSSNINRTKTDLRLKYNFTTIKRDSMLEDVKKDKSRFLALHLATPNSYMTRSRVELL